VATYTFPIWQPILASRTSNDSDVISLGLPPAMEAMFRTLRPDQQQAYLRMAQENPDMARQMVIGALQPPTEVPEADQEMPTMLDAEIVASGEFTRVSPIAWARGTATIFQSPDNRQVLRLENFECANGPNLHVILSASPNPATQAEVELNDVALDLGPLKGNIGSQNYDIPANTDINQYNSVVIYSHQFNIIFSIAPLFSSF